MFRFKFKPMRIIMNNMIRFQLHGKQAFTISNEHGEEHTSWQPTTFLCAYDTKAKKAFFLRNGGTEIGKEIENLPTETVEFLTK